LSDFEQDAIDRFYNGSPLGPRSSYQNIHTAALDAFVTSRQHGRELWNLHYQADVKIADNADDITRVQSLVLQQLDGYWSEKAREKAKQKQNSGPRYPS
jgi:hypothetical protein